MPETIMVAAANLSTRIPRMPLPEMMHSLAAQWGVDVTDLNTDIAHVGGIGPCRSVWHDGESVLLRMWGDGSYSVRRER